MALLLIGACCCYLAASAQPTGQVAEPVATAVDDTAAAAKAAEENLKVLQNKLKLNALGDEELRALVSPADCDFSYAL